MEQITTGKVKKNKLLPDYLVANLRGGRSGRRARVALTGVILLIAVLNTLRKPAASRNIITLMSLRFEMLVAGKSSVSY